jgi:hypothetical protein
MFGGGELNASGYSSSFGWRIAIFGWYAWGAVAQIRGNIDCYVQGDRLRRPRSFPKVILEGTGDICTRDVQLIERKRILNKTNHVESQGV